MGKRFKVAPDVKADIIRRVKEEGIPVSQAAKEHGVSDASIYTWLSGGVKTAPTWSEFAKMRRERDELLRIVGELTVNLSTAQKKSW